MYPLVESIKIKNGFAFHLSLHQERMNRSYRALFGTACPIELWECVEHLKLPETGLHKCRLSYGDGVFAHEIQAYIPQQISSLKLINDDAIDYAHKFSDRTHLTALLKQKGTADEILIVKNNLITDASYANVIFWDGTDWFTPSTPLLKGVQREKLLKEGRIHETEIRPSDLSSYQKVALINAMLDFEDKLVIDIKNIGY